jgi:hypothetical protein
MDSIIFSFSSTGSTGFIGLSFINCFPARLALTDRDGGQAEIDEDKKLSR